MEALIPYSPAPPSLTVRAGLRRRGAFLDFQFELLDPGGLSLQPILPGNWSQGTLARADQLWESTCFEAFWARPGEPAYWEMNLSPSGRLWNCYFFEKYRSPAVPAACSSYEMVKVRAAGPAIECTLKGPPLGEMEASLCAIVQTREGAHFFAGKHCGGAADFHARDSFALQR